MNSRFAGLIVMAVVVTATLFSMAAEPSKTSVSLETRIAKLVQERLETLDDVVKLKTAGFRQGEVNLGELIQARIQLHDAQLETTKTHKERENILAQQLQQLRELEVISRQRAKAFELPHYQVLSITALRLKAEIDLLTEQSRG